MGQHGYQSNCTGRSDTFWCLYPMYTVVFYVSLASPGIDSCIFSMNYVNHFQENARRSVSACSKPPCMRAAIQIVT